MQCRNTRAMTPSELRDVQLGVLDEFNRFASEVDLRWFLAAGSLLGAIRHDGYIPWDDDIDVMLPRADYETFCRLWVDGPQFELAHGQPFLFPYARLCDRRTVFKEPYRLKQDFGVGIDVFPIDVWPRHGARRAAVRTSVRLLRRTLMGSLLPIKDRTEGKSRWLRRCVLGALRLLPAQRLSRAISQLAQNGSRYPSDRMGIIVWGYGEAIPSRLLASTGEHSFEGRVLPVPRRPDKVLAAIYGESWRVPPPLEARVSHHSAAAYWKLDADAEGAR